MYKTIKLRSSLLICVGAILVAGSLIGSLVMGPVAEPDPYPLLHVDGDAAFVPQSGKCAYLTFDDGPSVNTPVILDLLKEKGIQATFFVTDQDEEYFEPMLKRMAAEGHTIGLHSDSHSYSSIYQSADSFLQDMDTLNQKIIQCTGVHPEIYRFPGGSSNKALQGAMGEEIRQAMAQRGYVYYDWNCVSNDSLGQVLSPDVLYRNMLQSAKGKNPVFLLCHDFAACTTTPAAVEMIIDELLSQGYTFYPLSRQVEPYQFVPLDQ